MDWSAAALRQLAFLLALVSASSQSVSQETLDYMAKHVKVKYEVVDNFRDSLKTFSCQVSLTNTGDKPVPSRGWVIYWTQLNLLEPNHHPYPEGYLLPDYGIRFKHVQGGQFSMEPDEGFEEVQPGETRVIRFLSENYSVSRTDTYPNWYLAAPGLEPRTIVSTAGEELDWVGDFDAENKWKRFNYDIPEAKAYDRYDPYTAGTRYSVNEVEDLGGPKKHVIPTPAEMSVTEGSHLQLNTRDWAIFAPAKFSSEAKLLGERLGINVVNRKPKSHAIVFKSADIRVTVEGKQLSGPEAYSLTVDPAKDMVEIRSLEPQGAFYGAMSLLNLKDEDHKVPEASIVDAPRFEYRGLMLDVARNFHPMEDVLRLLDLMAQYKLNKFHFHLTDDEGWRLEIPGLEELTTVAGRRCHDLAETECLLPFLGSGPAPNPRGSGFYTIQQYKTILKYAARRHIQVIPEVDMPGHGHAAIKAMEARRKRFLAANNHTEANRFVLVDDDDPSWYKSIQLFLDNAVNPCLDSTYNFVTAVVRSLVETHADIQPLKTFHFGGDEVAKGAWDNSTACNTLLTSGFDFRNYKDLKEYFVRQVSNITHNYGLDLAAWEDGVMQKGSDPYTRSELENSKVYAYAWDNVWEWGVANRAHKLANNGFKVVMAQATHMYFDHPYEPDPEERGLYWAPRFTHTRKAFSFMPTDLYANADVARSGDPVKYDDLCGDDGEDCIELKKPENIAGIQGHLWSEVIRSRQQADYMLFPRFFALVERAWHEPAWERETENNMTRIKKRDEDWAEFANTLGYRELARLDRQGVEYRVPPPGAKMSQGKLVTNVPFPGLKVEFSDDGGATWCETSDDMPLTSGTTILLRTRSASGGRYSRHVQVRIDAANSAQSLVVTSLVILSSAFSLLFNKFFL
ncbi:beta-hexosaminidase-like [Littorina saxatilis]|uniref:beta-N-acetylhexosaminidase n=1 Tax=Littorina saxatilis TaxID=31220 RepID=A0AAN9BBJ7_9CAEN